MTQKIIQHGAEAKIILKNNLIIKDRIPKSYRIPELDNKIRKRRTKSEIKLLTKASKIINVPFPQEIVNKKNINYTIIYGRKKQNQKIMS